MGRIVRVRGLPDFNAPDDPTFKITKFDGWFDAPAPDVSLSPNGGAAGAVASGTWLPAEAYLSLVGNIKADEQDLEFYRDQLLTAFPTNRDVALQVITDPIWGEGKQIWVRRYDRATCLISSRLDFTMPLVATDPYRYALSAIGGQVSVFTGRNWYRRYGGETAGGGGGGGTPTDTYTDTYADAYGGTGGGATTFPLTVRKYTNSKRTYQQAEPEGFYPDSLSLQSYGNAVSRRVTASIVGPLTAGRWWLYNENEPSRRFWVNIGLTAEQVLRIDTRRMLVTLNGEDVTDFAYGDWPTLAPGENVFRLAASAPSKGYAVIDAYEAYE